MPINEVFQIIIVLVFIVLSITGVTIVRKKRIKKLQVVADILGGKVKCGMGGYGVTGLYKDRKTEFNFVVDGKYSYKLFVAMQIKIKPDKNKKFKILKPKPTENTKLHNDQVRWERNFASLKDMERRDFIEILEEVIKAVEIVETNAPFYIN